MNAFLQIQRLQSHRRSGELGVWTLVHTCGLNSTLRVRQLSMLGFLLVLMIRQQRPVSLRRFRRQPDLRQRRQTGTAARARSQAQQRLGRRAGSAPDGSIYFTDMPFGKDDGMILRFDPKTKKTSVFTDKAFKSNGLAFDLEGNLLSCDGADGGGRCIRRWNLKTGKSEILADRYQGKHLNSPNDLCVDLKGRIYFTDPRYGGTEPRELEKEAVYRLNKDGTVIEITHDVEKPNGLALSPDQKTLYLVDHNNGGNRLSPSDPEPKRGAMKIYAFALDNDGLIKGERKRWWISARRTAPTACVSIARATSTWPSAVSPNPG